MNTLTKEAYLELSREFIGYVDELDKNDAVEALFGEPLKQDGDEPLEIPLDLYFGIKVENVWSNGVPTEDLEDFQLSTFKITGTGWLDESGDLQKAARDLMNEIHEKELCEGLSLLAQLDVKPLEVAKVGELNHEDLIILKVKSSFTDLFVPKDRGEQIASRLIPENLVVKEEHEVVQEIKKSLFEGLGDKTFFGANFHGVKGLEKGGALNKLFAQVGGWNPDEREIAIAVDGSQEMFLRAIKEIDGRTIKIYPVFEKVDGEDKIGFRGETEQGFVFAGKGVSFLLI